VDFAQIQSPVAGLKSLDRGWNELTRENINFECCARKGVIKAVGVGDNFFDPAKSRSCLLANKHGEIVRKMDSRVNLLVFNSEAYGVS